MTDEIAGKLLRIFFLQSRPKLNRFTHAIAGNFERVRSTMSIGTHINTIVQALARVVGASQHLWVLLIRALIAHPVCTGLHWLHSRDELKRQSLNQVLHSFCVGLSQVGNVRYIARG